MYFLNELKRRNVLRVGAAYVVAAWLVIQVVETILPAFGFGDAAVRFVTIGFAIGFIPALILTWVFEFTPEGLKRDAEVDHSKPISRAITRKLDRAIIVVLTLALAWFAFDEFVIESQPGSEIETSIAVLPFSNRSAIADDAFFVDGIHDDILTQLANLSGLAKVISRTSVSQYRDTNKTMLQIGEELGVANILEGGVQRAGNRIRINMQLIDAATDKHLWAETYDREMTVENLFAIQSEIAREVVLALNGVLSEQDDTKLDRQPTTSLEAYGEFVLGRQEMAKRTVEAIDKGMTHFEKAIELDPDYAMAYVGLASSIQLRTRYVQPRQDISEVSVEVQSLIDKAISLDPLSGEAWAALGLLRRAQGNNEEAEKYYLKAIDLSPNYASAYHWYSILLISDEGKRELALQYIQKAIELDPLADVLKGNLANTLRHLGRMDENLNVLKQGHARNPDFFLYYPTIATSLKYSGQIAEALQWSLEAVERAPNHRAVRHDACDLLVNLAIDQLAETCLLELVEDFPNGDFYAALADLYQDRGDYQEALAVILKSHPEAPEQWQEVRLAFAYLGAAKVEEAMRILNTILPQYFGDDPVSVSENEIWTAVTALSLLQTDGQIEKAEALSHTILEAVITAKRREPGDGYHFLFVFVPAAIGDRPTALAALREAIDSGWRWGWRGLHHRLLNHMREEPEWNAMMDELEDDISRQREWFFEHRDDPLP